MTRLQRYGIILRYSLSHKVISFGLVIFRKSNDRDTKLAWTNEEFDALFHSEVSGHVDGSSLRAMKEDLCDLGYSIKLP